MSEGALFCWRCDEPITEGQPRRQYVKISVSAGGATILVHEECPQPPNPAR
ncbi:hypothetical protein AB0C93_17170 [Streptomyces sp. NPDC048518]|uniref:hypothetical protein n=1 Tax=Streptomyces sp. NPDC048518 TaxID=3155029 RepID=UPI0033C74BCE